MPSLLLQPLLCAFCGHRDLCVLLDLHVHDPHSAEHGARLKGGPNKRVWRYDFADYSLCQNSDDHQIIHHRQEPPGERAPQCRERQQKRVAAHHCVRGDLFLGALVSLICQYNSQTVDQGRFEI